MTDTGTFIAYRNINFREAAVQTIGRVNAIIEQYGAQGMTLSVRQVYYQFVSRGWIPNNDKEYSKLQSLISDGRIAGLISWTAIEDRNRQLMGLRTYDGPAQVLREARSRYKADLWADQDWCPEVWVEKAALEGVISTICNELRVDFFAQRGYNSQSEQWRAGRRFADYTRRGQRPIVFHLGDHDPSGINMTEDNRGRLEMFCGVPVTVQRLALNMDQVRRYNPPPNPAKMTDSRAEDYVGKYGTSSWELDALEPTVIRDLISDAVLRIRDEKRWDAALAEEVADLEELDDMIKAAGGDQGDD